MVLCVDEKSQIQALNRTQPALPMWPGLPTSMTHDYIRHGTSSLFAAPEVATGKVHGRSFKRHTYPEFIAFLELLSGRYPRREVHLICDNYGLHSDQRLVAQAGERWFALITGQAIRRSSFDRVARLKRAIMRWLAHWNENAQPFRWTKSAAIIKRSLHHVTAIYETRH